MLLYFSPYPLHFHLGLVVPRDLHQSGRLLLARWAPGRPEVEQDDVAGAGRASIADRSAQGDGQAAQNHRRESILRPTLLGFVRFLGLLLFGHSPTLP